MPPNISALFDNFVPHFFPSHIPKKERKKVTIAIILAHMNAIHTLYSAMVNPTDSASIEVAIPCIMSAKKPTLGFSNSLLPCLIPYIIIFVPITPRSNRAIQGIICSNAVKYSTIVCTHIQPIIGMTA